jgi:hypothetical protein
MPGARGAPRTAAGSISRSEAVQQAEAGQHHIEKKIDQVLRYTQVFKMRFPSLRLAPFFVQFLDVQHLLDDLLAYCLYLVKNLKCQEHISSRE